MTLASRPLFAMMLLCVASGSVHAAKQKAAGPAATSACTDFYEFANGNWRAQHAIPDYMDRWSRRWESGEINKERVRDILAEVSARQDWPAGSAEQLAGDFYAACMDESRVNELGIAPALPLLKEMQAIKTSADIQNALTQLHKLGIPVPFAVYSTQDLHDPNMMIASGRQRPGPARSRLLSPPDDRFVEARDATGHVAMKFFWQANATTPTNPSKWCSNLKALAEDPRQRGAA
jgi:endothelin-converting enzyme/putative endopeptidase